MSNIVCARCGEEWDSTGGLHHSHSDLIEEDYKRLLDGVGCLCCRENIAAEAASYTVIEYTFIGQWQRSVEHLAEGVPEYMYATFDKQPIRGVPLESLFHPEVF